MSLPSLTIDQIFIDQVFGVIRYVSACVQGNPNGQAAPAIQWSSQLNIMTMYTNCAMTLFSNPNGTQARAMEIMGTQAGATLKVLASLYAILSDAGLPKIVPLPAYTVAANGTATLTE